MSLRLCGYLRGLRAVENAAATRLIKSFEVLKLKGFRFLFLGNICVNFAQWTQMIGLGWLVYELTGSATQGICVLLASPAAWVLSDRINRRTLLMASTALNAVQAVGLAVLVVGGHAQIWELYAYAIAGGVAGAISQPCRQALLFDLVGREGIARAVPFNNLSMSGTRILAPAVAGMVISFTGTADVFHFQSVLALMAMGFTFLIGPIEQATANGRESPIQTPKSGVGYAAINPAILGQLVVGIIPTLLV